MRKEMMRSKIHKAIVTQADLHYTGSITVDKKWLDAAGLQANDKVLVVNNNNGKRFETYIIIGEAGSKVICVNGAASRLVAVGDVLIIIAFGTYNEVEARHHTPKVIFPQEDGSYITLDQLVDNELNVIYLKYANITAFPESELREISMKYGYSIESIYHKYKN